jgi:hypothetical protein
MTQTAYTTAPADGVVGQIVRGGIHPVTVSRIANGAVRPGQYVVFNDVDCNHPSAAPVAGNKGGIALRKAYGQSDGVYADNEPVDILVQGEVWCAFENAITAQQDVFVRYASGGGGTQLGALRTNADTSTAASVTGVRTNSAGTALVKVQVGAA